MALGRALVRRPRILLLDEPLTDLDAWLRQEMTAELKRLQTELGQTTIYATHDFEEAVTMADRIAVLEKGRVEQLGAPEEMYRSPSSTVVASLVGTPSMNLIPCRVEDGADGEQFLVRDESGLRVRWRGQRPIPTDEVVLGIRPEHIEVSEQTGEEWIRSTAEIIQPLGEEQMADLRLADGTLVKIVTGLETSLGGDGKPVQIRIPGERVLLFDRERGRRIG